jgi:hypothetical protein
MNTGYTYLVFSVFNCLQTSLLAFNSASEANLIYGIHVFIHYINTISIDQNLMSPVQSELLLIFLDIPNDIF